MHALVSTQQKKFKRLIINNIMAAAMAQPLILQFAVSFQKACFMSGSKLNSEDVKIGEYED